MVGIIGKIKSRGEPEVDREELNTGAIDCSVFTFSSFMKNCRSRLLLGSKLATAIFAINQ